jgi:hypothetical protein
MPPEIAALKSAFSTNTNLAQWAAAAVFWGLIGDISVILIFDLFDKTKSWWEICLAGLASALIATGVWGESHFGSLATAASSQLQEYLEKEAADARLETAKLKKELAGRHLTPQQMLQVARKLRSFAGEKIVVLAYQDGFEPWVIADQIAFALGGKDGAGWVSKFGRVKELNRAFGGILIEMAPNAVSRDEDAAKALAHVLADAGLLVVGPRPMQSVQSEVLANAENGPKDEPIHLTVGTNVLPADNP